MHLMLLHSKEEQSFFKTEQAEDVSLHTSNHFTFYRTNNITLITPLHNTIIVHAYCTTVVLTFVTLLMTFSNHEDSYCWHHEY